MNNITVNSLDKYVKAEDFVVHNEDYFDRSGVVVADEEHFQQEKIFIFHFLSFNLFYT